ncbi:MAG: acylphosphatase [Anaerolineales bacterium]|nr:acylphosphatase [Anaerolineales bacterium]
MSEASVEEQVRLTAEVIGRVQGVGFRYFVAEHAERLAVTGWVRNRWDGSVEVTAEGPRIALERLIIQLERGPASAYVSRVQVQWEPATGEFSGFRVRGTV